MSIDEALEVLVNDRSFWIKTGLSNIRRHYFKTTIGQGAVSISLDKKIELLKSAGFEIDIKVSHERLI